MKSTLLPGVIPNAFLTFRGMTAWHLLDTVVAIQDLQK
jgi:hypothetical protein